MPKRKGLRPGGRAAKHRRCQLSTHAYEQFLARCTEKVTSKQVLKMVEYFINHAEPVTRPDLKKKIAEQCVRCGYKRYMDGGGNWVYWLHRASGLCFVTSAVDIATYRVITLFELVPPKSGKNFGSRCKIPTPSAE